MSRTLNYPPKEKSLSELQAESRAQIAAIRRQIREGKGQQGQEAGPQNPRPDNPKP